MSRRELSLRHQHGFTLTELMISLTLGVFLITGVIEVYLSTTRSRMFIQSQAVLMENIYFANHFISKDIERTGNIGCVSRNVPLVNTLNPGNGYDYDFNNAIIGHDGDGSSWLPNTVPAVITGQALPDSDILTIRAQYEPAVTVTTPYMPNSSAALHISGTNTINSGDVVIISDCVAAAIFQVTNITNGSGANLTLVHNTGGSTSPGNITKDLGRSFGENAVINTIETVSYYIARDSLGIPGLFRRKGSAAAELIIPGVENMQILYGIDSNQNFSVNSYQSAKNVTNWSRVVSLRVGFMFRSEQTIRSSIDERTYQILDESFGPMNDRRMRNLYTTTISLRNRLR